MIFVPITTDETPEIATNEHWRGIMRRARMAAGLTQGDLATKVGLSQNVISGLESGKVQSSKGVLAISDVLNIPPPHALIRDELDRRWLDAGRVLRARAPNTFETLLRTAEDLANQQATNPEEH